MIIILLALSFDVDLGKALEDLSREDDGLDVDPLSDGGRDIIPHEDLINRIGGGNNIHEPLLVGRVHLYLPGVIEVHGCASLYKLAHNDLLQQVLHY